MRDIKIKDLPISERPVERLLYKGVSTLSSEELLAILLKTGSSELSAKGLARQILKKMGDIRKLKEINRQQLESIRGIGSMKAATILSFVELSKRMNEQAEPLLYKKLTNTSMVFSYYKEKLEGQMQECFYTIYLDVHKYIIEEKLLFKGSLNFSMVHPREIFKEALLNSASSIICIHNHPSGNPFPSKQDIQLTQKLVEAGNQIGIPIIDHIIIGSEKYYSFFENDLIYEENMVNK